MKKSIHQYSIGYNFLRDCIALSMRVFYKKITIEGKENIPKDKPIIYALNHQNALLDALSLSVLRSQQVFLARSDIFKGPAGKFLRFIKMLPIYRIRDGAKNLQNNDAVFEEVVGVLENNKAMGILPEGSHLGQKRLKVLKKGIARIAFKAEERNDFNLDIQVVPVGLDYTNYINFGGSLLINFGEPFNLAPFKEEYLENDQKGMNSFMIELRKRMIPMMLNIDDSNNYEEVKTLVDLFSLKKEMDNKTKLDHYSKLKQQQSVSSKIIALKESNVDTFNSILENAKQVSELVNKLNFRQWVLKKEKYSALGIIFCRLLQLILFPIYLYGFLTNIIQFQLPVYLSRNVKDPQFLSSFRLVLGFAVYTIFILICFPLIFIFTASPLVALGYALSIPVSGVLAFKYYVWYKKTSARFRNNRLRRKNNPEWITLRKNWDEVIEFFDKNIEVK